MTDTDTLAADTDTRVREVAPLKDGTEQETESLAEAAQVDIHDKSHDGISEISEETESSQSTSCNSNIVVTNPSKVVTLPIQDSDEVTNPKVEETTQTALVDESNIKFKESDFVTNPSIEMDSVTYPSNEINSATNSSNEIESVTHPSMEMNSVSNLSNESNSVVKPANKMNTVTDMSYETDSLTDPSFEIKCESVESSTVSATEPVLSAATIPSNCEALSSEATDIPAQHLEPKKPSSPSPENLDGETSEPVGHKPSEVEEEPMESLPQGTGSTEVEHTDGDGGAQYLTADAMKMEIDISDSPQTITQKNPHIITENPSIITDNPQSLGGVSIRHSVSEAQRGSLDSGEYSEVEDPDNVSDHNVISIPDYPDSKAADLAALVSEGSITVDGLKLEHGGRIQVSQSFSLPSHITLSNGSTYLINHQNNILAAAMAGNITGDIITYSGNNQFLRMNSSQHGQVKLEHTGGISMLSKPPSTDILLKTAREVLQLSDDPIEYRRVFTDGMNVTVDCDGNILSTSAADQSDMSITDEMEVTDDNETYILESVDSGEFYEDPNIMWIEETVEVGQAEQEAYDNLPNMVIILNPNGTVNEELMLANGMNMETIKAVTDAATGGLNLQTVIPVSSSGSSSIASLQHPIPKKLLTGVQPLGGLGPRTIIQSAAPITSIKTQRSVILDHKEDFLVLDDIKDSMYMCEGGMKQQLRQVININGTQHIITSSRPLPELRKINTSLGTFLANGLNVTPLGTLDLSLPKKVDPSGLDQYVNPSALVPENTVLKVLDQSDLMKVKRTNAVTKIRRPRMRDENGNGSPYIHRKTTSLGALGQALHGIPRDSRENAVQICPICKFQATTKNPYRHLQDHLARVHFKDRIAAELPTKKPYVCPFEGCDGKQYPDWQAVMRHYIGKKHGILDKYVKEELCQIRRDNGGRIPGTIIRPGVELML